MQIFVLSLILLVLVLLSEAKPQSLQRFGVARFKSGKDLKLDATLVQTSLLRGGAQVDTNDNEDSEVDNSDEEGEEDEEEGNGAFDKEKSLVLNTINSIWQKTPPMTQVYVGSSIVVTLLSFVLNKNVWPDFLHFSWSGVLSGQLWRVATAFLFFGQLDLFFPLTMQFVWQHMSQLEKLSYNKPEDFLVMVLFGAGTLISLYTLLGISMKFLGHNLATYLVYIWSRVFEGSDVNFMDLAILKSEMLPWVFCAQTFLLERELPLADLIGIAVGHVYYYLKNKDVLKAPEVIWSWFQSERMKARYAQFKTDFE